MLLIYALCIPNNYGVLYNYVEEEVGLECEAERCMLLTLVGRLVS